MWRRASVVHVVDELTRAQRRERLRTDVEALAIGVLWALWCVRVELLLVLALVAVQRATAAVVGDAGGLVVCVLLVAGRDWDRAGATGSAAAAACDGRSALVGAGDDRLRASRPVRSGVPASGRSLACPAGDLLRVRVRRGQSVG